MDSQYGYPALELTYKYLRERGLDEEYSRITHHCVIGDYLDETSWARNEIIK